jgi:hypothetical protein
MHPAEDNLHEAEFFFLLMRHHLDEYEFKYLLSAFLSALSSCTEHNRLFSRDLRYRDWYQDLKNIVRGTVLERLDVLRNKEVHRTGTQALQRVGCSTGSEEPITSTHIEITMNFREGRPKGTYQTGEMATPEPIELTAEWVWSVEGSPKVMELCLD